MPLSTTWHSQKKKHSKHAAQMEQSTAGLHTTFSIFFLFLLFLQLLLTPILTTALVVSINPFQSCNSNPSVQGPFHSMWYVSCSDSPSHTATLDAYNETSDEWTSIVGPLTGLSLVPDRIANFVVAEITRDTSNFLRAKKNKNQREPPVVHLYLVAEHRPCFDSAEGVDNFQGDPDECAPVRSLVLVRKKHDHALSEEQSKFNQVSTLQTRSDCGFDAFSPPLVWSTFRQTLFTVCSTFGNVMTSMHEGRKITYHLGEDVHCLADNIALGSKQDQLYVSCSLEFNSHTLPPYIVRWNLDHGALVRVKPAESRFLPVGDRWRQFVPPIPLEFKVNFNIIVDPEFVKWVIPPPPTLEDWLRSEAEINRARAAASHSMHSAPPGEILVTTH